MRMTATEIERRAREEYPMKQEELERLFNHAMAEAWKAFMDYLLTGYAYWKVEEDGRITHVPYEDVLRNSQQGSKQGE